MAEGRKLIELLDSDDEPTEVEQMERELLHLRELVQHQRDVIQHMEPTVIKQEPAMHHSSPPQSPPKRIHTKPRDIPILELHQLEGLDATAHLQMFIELVEQVADDDLTRVTVAKSRLGSEIAMLVHNKQQKERNLSWKNLCQLLKTEFTLDINLDRAWQDLESVQYEWEESPQSFSNRFLCKYAVLETKFPQEKFPSRDKTIKRLIFHGLPKELRDRVEGFLDEEYPLTRFLDRVEYQRQMHLQTHLPFVSHIKEKSQKQNSPGPSPPGPLNSPDHPTPSHLETVRKLEEKVKTLTTQLERLQTPSTKTGPQPLLQPRTSPSSSLSRPQLPPSQYCPYCRNNSHNLRECWRAPKNGACFDCGRQQCRRGNPSCPAKTQNNI